MKEGSGPTNGSKPTHRKPSEVGQTPLSENALERTTTGISGLDDILNGGLPQVTGLGLWVTSEIMKKDSWTIRVRSSRNPLHTGTVFSIVIPKIHLS
jgi:hypothetical protein